MRQSIMRRGLIHGRRDLGGEKREVIDSLKLPIFDVRLLLVIAVAMINSMHPADPDPAQKLTPTRVVRGEHRSEILRLAVSRTGERLATIDASGRIAVRTAATGWRIDRALEFPGWARGAAFSPDGSCLAAIGLGSDVHLWELNTPEGQPATRIAVPIQRAGHVAFSPDGLSLAVTTDLDGSIVLWDLTRQREHMVLHHPSPVSAFAFSPDGHWLASGGSRDGSILLWDLNTGSRQVLSAAGQGSTVTLVFSPDGNLLASARESEHFARIWEVNSRCERRVFARHNRSVNSVAFSPDSSLLVTAANDGTLGLWTVATGQHRVSLDGDATCLRSVAFSPDGETIVLATEDDDDIRLWDLADIL